MEISASQAARAAARWSSIRSLRTLSMNESFELISAPALAGRLAAGEIRSRAFPLSLPFTALAARRLIYAIAFEPETIELA